MSLVLTLGVCLLLLVVSRLVASFASSRRIRRPLPPGPKPRLFIGNLLDLPKVTPWKTYQEWRQIYGDVIHLHVPWQPIIVLNSAKAALDLLEKRSDIYSDRIRYRMWTLIGWDFSLAISPYGPIWRSQRRLFHQYFNQTVVHAYQGVQLEEVRKFLSRALESPEHIKEHINHTFISVILRIVYGKKIQGLSDEYIQIAETSLDGMNVAAIPGRHWVEFLPFLSYIPSWCIGGDTQRIVKKYRPAVEAMLDKPLVKINEALATGEVMTAAAYDMLKSVKDRNGGELSPENYTLVKNVAGIAYAAAVETTTASSEVFLLAMAMHPEVQKKAQAELDLYVGSNRLPEFYDLDSLIYIQAIALEVTRWIPVVPNGIAHRLMVDDEYNGYFIPKGTIAIANVWAMMRDPEDYPEPDVFKPERFIKDGKINTDIRNPNTMAFGFGRRICPGRHLSNAMFRLFIASILHVFNVEAGRGRDGKMQELSLETETGLVIRPNTVPHGLKPRSQAAAASLVRQQSSIDV
ncbi:cytochrome P450 98A3 [Cristinia sonorae]|uniref:Cytochrome P450 98A3 n=1 Tax=Cristinia sonorae TaxID=1940300 RepID=A0A8K0UM49_9AGAR|nr:cytochrome P450 98A3 [Cristinia sonorae]